MDRANRLFFNNLLEARHTRRVHVILYQPEIPPNTGNVIRLCANTGASLHLIEPLGFALDDARLRRAGLDYHEFAAVQVHADLTSCLVAIDTCTVETHHIEATRLGANDSGNRRIGAQQGPGRLYAVSTRGMVRYDMPCYGNDDAFLFGPETRGLPADVLAQLPETQRLRLPMQPHNRSLNLSNAVAVVVFEAWRQLGFAGSLELGLGIPSVQAPS